MLAEKPWIHWFATTYCRKKGTDWENFAQYRPWGLTHKKEIVRMKQIWRSLSAKIVWPLRQDGRHEQPASFPGDCQRKWWPMSKPASSTGASHLMWIFLNGFSQEVSRRGRCGVDISVRVMGCRICSQKKSENNRKNGGYVVAIMPGCGIVVSEFEL